MNAELVELLNRASLLWKTTRRGYRDGLIEVGSLLLQYVRRKLATGDNLNELERRRNGISRASAVADCSRSLSVRPLRINELIRLGVVAELLAPSSGFGSLSFASLRVLHRLVHRPHRGEITRVKNCADGFHPLSSLEEWAIRPEFSGAAVELVATAVAESWTSSAILSAIRRVSLPATAPRRGRSPSSSTVLTTGRIAKQLQVAPRTVSKWVDSGMLPGYKLPGGGDRRVRPVDLLDFIRSRGMPIPVDLGSGEAVAFAVEPCPALARFKMVDAFELGYAVASHRVSCAIIGDAEGSASAARAVEFIRDRNPGALVVLAVSSDRAGEPFTPDDLTKRVVMPCDWGVSLMESTL